MGLFDFFKLPFFTKFDFNGSLLSTLNAFAPACSGVTCLFGANRNKASTFTVPLRAVVVIPWDVFLLNGDSAHYALPF